MILHCLRLSGGTYATLAPRNRSRQQHGGGSSLHSYTLHRPPPLPKAPPTAPGSSSSQRPDITRDLVARDKSSDAPQHKLESFQRLPIENGSMNVVPANEGGNKPDLTNHILQRNAGVSNIDSEQQMISLKDYNNSVVFSNIQGSMNLKNNNSNEPHSTNPNFKTDQNNSDNCDSSTLRRNSRRGRSSSERTDVSQLVQSDKNGHFRHRRPPSSERSAGSSDGSGSRSSSSLSGKNKSPKHFKRPSNDSNISEYLNTDTIRRNTPLAASQHVVFSSSYSPPTIYYTTRPTRNATPEKHKRKKSLGSYPNEDLRSRKNSKSRSREDFDRSFPKNVSAKYNLEKKNSTEQL